MMLKSKRWLACAVALTASITAAGCSSSGSSGTGGGSASTSASASGTYPVTAGVLHAFTGQNAFFGLNAQNACKAAALQINAAGGIMGHSLNCTAFDTKGDPADAVPVTTADAGLRRRTWSWWSARTAATSRPCSRCSSRPRCPR